jgi:hypothetical protein
VPPNFRNQSFVPYPAAADFGHPVGMAHDRAKWNRMVDAAGRAKWNQILVTAGLSLRRGEHRRLIYGASRNLKLGMIDIPLSYAQNWGLPRKTVASRCLQCGAGFRGYSKKLFCDVACRMAAYRWRRRAVEIL